MKSGEPSSGPGARAWVASHYPELINALTLIKSRILIHENKDGLYMKPVS